MNTDIALVSQICLDVMVEVDDLRNPQSLLISKPLSAAHLLDMIEFDRPAPKIFSQLNDFTDLRDIAPVQGSDELRLNSLLNQIAGTADRLRKASAYTTQAFVSLFISPVQADRDKGDLLFLL